MEMPLIAFRNMPGKILKNTAKRLGVSFETFTFKDPEKGMDALDRIIDKGIPVGLRTGVYWLPYMPDVCGFISTLTTSLSMAETATIISSVILFLMMPVVCSRKDLMKARFSEGLMAPKGFMYYLSDVPDNVDFLPAIRKGIKDVCHVMIHFPFPLIGVRGIKMFAKALRAVAGKIRKTKGPSLSRPCHQDAGRDRHRRRRISSHVCRLPS